MRNLIILLALIAIGCDGPLVSSIQERVNDSLVQARKGFVTKIVSTGEEQGAPEMPEGEKFELIYYKSPVGRLPAYLTTAPGDGKKHPAVVWITGGDNNTIGDVWSPTNRANDQSVSSFQKAGIVVMFPSQRGGNDNPGKREGFFGEVDDILAATDHLAKLPYVDANQIYLGGHSTGGTLVMLVGASTDRYRGIFSLGPVAAAEQYGGNYIYCDPNNKREMELRSPINWMHCVKSPMLVIEGEDGNWKGAVEVMANRNTNSKIQFFKVDGHDHFSVIAPVAEELAKQILTGQVNITQQTIQGLR